MVSRDLGLSAVGDRTCPRRSCLALSTGMGVKGSRERSQRPRKECALAGGPCALRPWAAASRLGPPSLARCGGIFLWNTACSQYVGAQFPSDSLVLVLQAC